MTVSPSFSLLMKYLLFPVHLQCLILFFRRNYKKCIKIIVIKTILIAWLLVVELTSRRRILKMVIWIKYQERRLAEITSFCSAKSIPQSFKTNDIDSENCEKCINLSSNSELQNWKFPQEGNVLLVMLKSLREDPGHKTSPLTNMSLDLMLHWIYFNIYIQSYKTVRKKNEELYKEYKLTKNYIKRVVKPTGIDLINLSKSVELTCLI